MKPLRLYALVVFALLTSACSKSDFERAHAKAVGENAAGVELEIRTIDGKNKVRLGQSIQYEEFFSSKYPGWRIEIVDGANAASIADTAHVTDGKSTWIPNRPLLGYVCCDSRRVWLTSDPLRIPNFYRSTSDGLKAVGYHRVFLPEHTGIYRFYVTTYRVFNKTSSMSPFHERGEAVTSKNILTIEVVN